MSSLSGRVALVTGGSRGIGRGIALALAQAGCDVAVNYVTHQSDANAVVEAIRGLGRRAHAVQADVSTGAGAAALVAATTTQLGAVDILVNNAGGMVIESIDQMSEDSWNRIVTLNLTSVFLMTQAVLPGMRA